MALFENCATLVSSSPHGYTGCIRFTVCCLHTVLSSANKCLLKVGAYCAQLEQYQKAIEIYEQVCLQCSALYLCMRLVTQF